MDTSNLFENYMDSTKVSKNIAEPTRAKILSGGEIRETQYGQKLVIKVRLEENDDIVCLRINKQMWSVIRKKYGSESSNWIGQEIGLYAVPQIVQGKQATVIYVIA
jgi:hypothetical protein